ncbi:helix-turn-helix transcriptional regulator [Halomicrobium urmianum]|uniref:helix-turn-helix transcriptional regulator n=1 Tax=Halomicrobium urmianum TaxID=1586233 RepID=UPI001CD99F9F|nr:ArsR family transcriptional regulator [Halomicrobium urmianum]
MPADDAVQFLAGSSDRLALLTSLADGPASPSELASERSLSRRSVQRNLAAFVDRGWAETDGGTYDLTVTGALVAEKHAAYVADLERVDEFAPFFRHLPDRDHTPDPAWLADAELTVSTSEDPQAPVHRYVTRVEGLDTGRIQMLSPVLSRLFHDAHASLAIEGVHTDLVMPAAMVERARERNPIEFKGVVAVDVLTLYRHPEPFSVGLTLADDRLLMAAYDDEKQLQALVESANPAFHAWASALFDRYQESAERVRR